MLAPVFVRTLRSPAFVTFWLSLLLSVISRSYRDTLNRDGMTYVETARIFVEEGASAAAAYFDWPSYAILIGWLSNITGIPYEPVGHILGALLLAGACTVMVRQVQLFMPQHGWLACLVVLSLPALNAWRDEILREDGYWLFILIAFWLASRRPTGINLANAIGPAAALGIAAVFRVEALAFYPTLLLWQWYALGAYRTAGNSLALFALPLLGLTIIASLFAFDVIELGRLERYWSYISPLGLYERFEVRAERLGKAALSHYAWDEANRVLLFGLIGLLISKFFTLQGALAAPLLYGLAHLGRKAFSLQPFGWLFLTYTCVVVLFTTSLFFASDRYMAPLGILSIPLIVFGLSLMMQRFQRLRALFIALIALTALDNVISLSPEKSHQAEAGKWLQEHNIPKEKTFIEDRRVAYYAGWGIRDYPKQATRESKQQAFSNPTLEYLVIIQSNDQAVIPGDAIEVIRFTNGEESIVMLQKKPNQ